MGGTAGNGGQGHPDDLRFANEKSGYKALKSYRPVRMFSETIPFTLIVFEYNLMRFIHYKKFEPRQEHRPEITH